MKKSVINHNRRSLFIAFLLGIWLLTTGAALVGMYKLWWERERQDYGGKTPAEQRLIIWQKAGLDEHLLATIEQLKGTWPTDISYRQVGSQVKLSYATYLLIPRLPTGGSEFVINESGDYAPKREATGSGPAGAGTPSAVGFLSSLWCLLGLALMSRRWHRLSFLSLPEAAAGTFFVVLVFALSAKAFTGSVRPGFLFLSGLAVLAWLTLGYAWIRKTGRLRRPSPFRPITMLGWASILIIGACVVWALVMSIIVVPDDWDAWAIWGAKAKTLALSTGPVASATLFGHPDYPLLWPSLWAYSGWLSGGWEEQWSRGWGAVLLLLCCWEIGVIIWRKTADQTTALLSGALFASMPMVPLVASWSYAEAPFWLYTICCFGLVLHYLDNATKSALILSAIMAAGAAYTKNEGVLFACVTGGWLALACRERRFASVALFFGIWAVCYSPWMGWVKLVLGLGSHATAGLHFNQGNLVRVTQRVPEALAAIGHMWLDVKQWNVVLGASLLALLASLAHRSLRVLLPIPAGMMGGYFIIVVFHNADVLWQIGTAWNRLTLQVMPFLIIVMTLWVHRQFKEGVSASRCSI